MSHNAGFNWLNNMIKAEILRFLPKEGRLETSAPGLALTRYDAESSPERCLCSPMVAFVAQGFKRAFYGEMETNYGAGQCVVLGIDVPAVFQIKDATPEMPFLSLSVKLDNQIISSLFAEMPTLAEINSTPSSPIGVVDAELELMDAFRRLVSLLEHPERIPILAPMILREIHFFVLSGKLGEQLRLFGTAGTKAYQISRAISWLRANYTTPFRIEGLAEMIHMASSTFNRYFRQVTGLSPLQFQKRLRLHEAERLMLVENNDATQAGLAVGYESGSQFTREYKRLFGAPPRRDMERRRAG